jgi:import inner membrane translocase subunit TIM50
MLPYRLATRSISTTSSLLVKIRSAKPLPKATAPSTPSPAERPPPIPDSISRPAPPFEPIVNRPGSVPAAEDPVLPQASAPLVPPTPEVSGPETASARTLGGAVPASGVADTAASTVSDASVRVEADADADPNAKLDFSKLPSLDIDQSVALPEPEAEGEGEGQRKRTGAARKEYVSSIERQRKMWTRVGLAGLALGGLGAVYYAGQAEGAAVSVELMYDGEVLSCVMLIMGRLTRRLDSLGTGKGSRRTCLKRWMWVVSLWTR